MTASAPARHTRQTKIVFTIGPATDDHETIRHLIRAGVNVCRFNMAHGAHDWVRQTARRVRQACDDVGHDLAILMDVKGPEIRTRDLPHLIELHVGELVEFTYAEAQDEILTAPRNADGLLRIHVNYPDFVSDLAVGDCVLVDSGLIHLQVVSIDSECARCQVVTAGTLGSRRHINLPGTMVNLPAITDKDKQDIALGIEIGVDIFALSFVRNQADVQQLREHLQAQGSQARIVAKIEDQSGVANLPGILEASDGIMVARGDLGIEFPMEQLPIFQRQAVDLCMQAGKPVIIATHLLESMIESPVPTRAEVSDVSNSVRELADCVMLSGETSVGKYPQQCVDVLNRIIETIERDRVGHHIVDLNLQTPKEKMLRAAVLLGEELGGTPILVFTRSGDLARLLSALRPNSCPIFAFTDIDNIYRSMALRWGVAPFLLQFEEDPEETIQQAFRILQQTGRASQGDQIIVITNVLGRGDRIIDTMQVREIN